MVEIHPERTAWEYRCLAVNKEDANKSRDRHWAEINKLGGKGWELVAVYPRQTSIDYVFKRQAPTTINTGVPRAGDE
jgi:Domain of unknown function (DUF4177)